MVRWFKKLMPVTPDYRGDKFFVREKILPVVLQTRDVHWFWDSEIMVLAHQAGLRIEEVDCRFERRADKQSTVRLCRDIWRYLVAIRAFRQRHATRRFASQPGRKAR